MELRIHQTHKEFQVNQKGTRNLINITSAIPAKETTKLPKITELMKQNCFKAGQEKLNLKFYLLFESLFSPLHRHCASALYTD